MPRTTAKTFLLQMRPRKHHYSAMPPMFGKLPKEQFSVQGKLLPESEPGRPVKTTSYNPSPNFVENSDLSLDTSRCDISPVKVLKRVQVPNDLDTSSSKPVNSDPKTRPKTLHERIANYYAVRSRIFGSQGCLVSEKIRKLRNRFIAKKTDAQGDRGDHSLFIG